MSERSYLFWVGATILAALYLECDPVIIGLCLWLTIEGVFDIRLTRLLQNLRGRELPSGLTLFKNQPRFGLEAFRVWRLSVAFFLGGSFLLLQGYAIEELWFFPWFMGFAIMGAGASGVCPMLLFLRWLGFR